MTTGDFEISRRGISGPVHLSDKENRQSIETVGLKSQDPRGAYPIEGHNLKGVYFYSSPYVADQEDGMHGANLDIWELTHKHQYEFNDDPHMQYEAIYTPDDVEPRHLRRVGHTTKNYEVHWHKEEDCNG
jgi:hypothetical protein